MDWYEWNVEMWGTKWNAYQLEIVSPTVVTFETAWSAPHPVIARLVEKNGKPLVHEWADEDTGNNVGRAEYSADGEVDVVEMSGTKEGYELRFDLDPGDAEYYEWNGAEYVYKDDED